MHIFRATDAHWNYMFLQHCSWGGGHKSFDHQMVGVTKILPRYFRKFMTPYSKEKVAPLGDRQKGGRSENYHEIFNKIRSLWVTAVLKMGS